MLGGRLPEAEKQKNVSNYWFKKWSRSLRNLISGRPFTREFSKQDLTEKQNGYF